MESIRQYFLSVCTAAIFCAIIGTLIGRKSERRGLVKLLCGLFLAFSVVQPIEELKLEEFFGLWADLNLDAAEAVQAGESFSRQAISDVIKSDTEAYILDRAKEMGLTLKVTVTLSSQGDPVPTEVSLQGNVSPEAKSRMQRFLTQELGIGKERQIWIP